MNLAQIKQSYADFTGKIETLWNERGDKSKDELKALKAQAEALGESLKELIAENENLSAEVEAAKEAIDMFKAEAQSASAKAKEDLEAQGKKVEIEASKKAAQIAATQGIPPVAVRHDATASGGTAKTAAETYQDMKPGAAKTQYYRENKAKILASR